MPGRQHLKLHHILLKRKHGALVILILEEAIDGKRSDSIVHSRAMVIATMIGDYLMENARRVIELLDISEDALGIRKSYRTLYNELPEMFTKAQANDAAMTLGLSPSTVDKFCHTLQKILILSKDRTGCYRKVSRVSALVRSGVQRTQIRIFMLGRELDV